MAKFFPNLVGPSQKVIQVRQALQVSDHGPLPRGLLNRFHYSLVERGCSGAQANINNGKRLVLVHLFDQLLAQGRRITHRQNQDELSLR